MNLLRSKSGDDLLGKSFADERRATFSIATNVITGVNYKKNSRPDSSSSEDPSETDVAGEVNHLHLRYLKTYESFQRAFLTQQQMSPLSATMIS